MQELFLDSLLDFWSFKMGPIGCPETSVRNYQYTLLSNPEERSSLLKVKCRQETKCEFTVKITLLIITCIYYNY